MIFYSSKIPNNTLQTIDQDYYWFSGTAYLGIAQHPTFKRNLIESLVQWGSSWGSSRNNNVRLSIYEEAEQALAQFFGAPAALTVASGMSAGQVTVSYYQSLEYHVEIAPKTHPALWPHHKHLPIDSYEEWASTISENISKNLAEKIVICSDSVGSPYVEDFDFSWIKTLPKNKEIVVVIDASHSLGIQHVADFLGFEPDFNDNIHLIVTGSLNKAMGMTGGVILGKPEIINHLRHTPMFAGASPMMPALLDAFMLSTGLYYEQKEKLQKNIQYFTENLEVDYLDTIKNYPAFCTHREGLHDFLKNHGVMTSCFPYPTVHDKPVSRLVISAMHNEDELLYLAQLCNQFAKISG
ncbi:MAG: aminotransferase class I/II-fold pyridoxal phosphate-dependent enzyme [Flectobacillus sp.]|uniref:aminotransferase class I/II-fold pyridoxal phosphate-dependent enzyme n=1 Tax=Flectobacillus sp. TaxID=50419 RepID=UPI003B9A6EB8